MAEDAPHPRPRCFLAFSDATDKAVVSTVLRSVRQAGFRPVPADVTRDEGPAIREAALSELARADCVVADLGDRDPKVVFEIGAAHAMGKGLFLLGPHPGLPPDVLPIDLRAFQILPYRTESGGLAELAKALTKALRDYARFPRRARQIPGARLAAPFFVDFDQLSPPDTENLCRELLAQMGYMALDWSKESREFDLIAELPKRDPDGFEYRELWLIAIGRKVPPDMLFGRALEDPDYFAHRFFGGERFERLMSRGGGDVPVTLLIIVLRDEIGGPELEMVRRRPQRLKGPSPSTVRLRVWDRTFLTTLIQQFPQLGYKYFSDEGRSKSKYRKTPEQLYSENVGLSNRLAASNSELIDEKNRRVRAERDAVWKDISFSAAHKMGNPVFAIETFLDPLEKRVDEGRLGEAKSVIHSIRHSVEKAKGIVDQFKSLTRAQEIKPVPTLVRPVLEDACKTAVMQGVACELECPPSLTVIADPDRFAECCDEIVSNATHWFDKNPKTLRVTAAVASPASLPQAVDSSRQYAVVHFVDNGAGVLLERKERIFDAFFTTRDHGAGLGLAVCRRIIEGHGGLIRESGRPGEGADFEIYLPVATAEQLVPADENLVGARERGA